MTYLLTSYLGIKGNCINSVPFGVLILVNIGSGNGLVPDGTKPLPEPLSPVAFTFGHFYCKYSKHQSVGCNYEFKITAMNPSA